MTILIICFLVSVNLFDDIILIYTGISIAGKVAQIMIIFLLVSRVLAQGVVNFSHRITKAFIILTVFFVASVICNNCTHNPKMACWESIAYELFKLFTPCGMLLLLTLRYESLITILRKLTYVFFVFLVINLIVIGLQWIFGSAIVSKFGMVRLMEFQFANNRPTGITTGANIIGVAALFIGILMYIFERNLKNFRCEDMGSMVVVTKFLAFALVVGSTSKNALIVLLMLPMYIYCRKPIYLLIALLVGSCALVFIYDRNIYWFRDKIDMYLYFASDIDGAKSHLIEWRLQSALDGIQLLRENLPLGLGLGTWGDFSCSLNYNIKGAYVNSMCDSYILHLMVEHGIFVLGYIAVFYVMLKGLTFGMFILCCIVFTSIPTMGFASSTFPLIMMLCIIFSVLPEAIMDPSSRRVLESVDVSGSRYDVN